MHWLHRGFSLLLVASVAALVTISAVAIVDNFGRNHADTQSAFFKVMNGNTVTAAEQKQWDLEWSRPSLTFVADQLSVTNKQLQGELQFEMEWPVQQEVVDTSNNTDVFDCHDSNCWVKSQYASSSIQLQLIASTPDGNYFFTKNVSLSEISGSNMGKVDVAVSVPLIGYPELYPQDNYYLDLDLAFALPDNMVRLINGQTPTGDNADFYEFSPGNLADSMAVKAVVETDAKGVPQAGVYHVSLTRKTLTAWYVYSVALIPLMFALLFLHLLFFSKHFAHKKFEEFTEALIVTILAVLPLRVVLVPAEIEGLTRVDLVLGLGLVLIVGVSICKYASEVWAVVPAAQTVGEEHAQESTTE